jgi:hypothetical protein
MKRVMKYGFVMVALCVSAIATYAQQDGKGDKIESLRIAFISQRLSLTPEEAQKFWPIYNSYRAEVEALRKNFKGTPESKPTADQSLDFEQKKLDLKKKYKVQFDAAIGKTKVDQLYALEREFYQKLKEAKDQREGHGGK